MEGRQGVDAVVHLAALTSVLEREEPARHVRDERHGDRAPAGGGAAPTASAGSSSLRRTRWSATSAGNRSPSDRAPPAHPVRRDQGRRRRCSVGLLRTPTARHRRALRFTNIYGAGMQLKDSVIARLLRAAKANGGIEIYGDGEQLRDYLYVTDAARAVVLRARPRNTPTWSRSERRESISMNASTRSPRQATGVGTSADAHAAGPGEMPAVVVDTAHAFERGFRPEYDALRASKPPGPTSCRARRSAGRAVGRSTIRRDR